MSVKVVADSAADLPREIVEGLDIRIVPLTVRFGDEEFVEGRDLDPAEFYRRMEASPSLPKTAQPTPAQFAKAFTEAHEASGGDGVFCVTISSGLSGTYQSANLGKEMSGRPVVILDSLAASLGEGVLAFRAAEAARDGLRLQALTGLLTKLRDELTVLIGLETLENVVRGGRLSPVKGFVAQLLNFKAILHNIDGRPVPLERVRGTRKLLEHLVELVGERGRDLADKVIGITHADNLAAAIELRDRLMERFRPGRIIVSQMGPTLGTYAGKGGLIIAF
ncbi:MAG TPA: DegV family protein [Bacillota bacterium]|jgi:DegV family protein with EDD domain